MSDDFKDGPHKSEVVVEHATSILVPIIPDADNYEGHMFTIRVPSDRVKEGAFIIAFTEANGKRIEAWMKTRGIDPANDLFAFELEDHGCVRISHRRKARDE
jgi:hypothetical protein